jgi:hypothetical protein
MGALRLRRLLMLLSLILGMFVMVGRNTIGNNRGSCTCRSRDRRMEVEMQLCK